MRNIYKELTKNTILVGFADLTVKLKYFILIPIFSKLIGATEYGIWVQIMVTVNMLLPLAILGMDSGFMRFLPGEEKSAAREDISSVSVIVFIFSVIAGLLIIIFAQPLCSTFIKEPDYLNLVRLSGLYLTTFALKELFVKYFRAVNKIILYSVFLFTESVVSISAIIVTILMNQGIYGALLSLTAMNIIFLVIYLILISIETGFCKPHFTNVASYLKYSIPLIPMAWFLWVINSSDRYFIGYFLGTKEVGIYSACYSISYFVIGIFSSPVLVAVPPVLTKLWNTGNREAVKEIISKCIKYLIFLILPCITGFTIMAKPLISSLTSPEFLGGIIIIPFVLAGYLLYVIVALTENVMFLFKKTKVCFIFYFISALVNFILNFLLIPKVGLLGAALSTALTFLLMLAVIILFTVKINFYMNYCFAGILRAVFSSLIMGFVVFFLRPNSIIRCIWSAAIGISVYFLIMVLTNAINRKELDYIKSFLSSTY